MEEDKCQTYARPSGNSSSGQNDLNETGYPDTSNLNKMDYPLVTEPQVILRDGIQPPLPDYEDLLYCNLCNKAFVKTVQYQNHMRNHRAERRFQCVHCSKSFSQSNNLRTHLRIHTKERPFKCNECGKAFSQVTNLNNHVRLHTGERPYVCSVPGCDKAFAQVTNLNNHRKSHQKDMPYACDLCDQIFQYQSQFETHRRKHSLFPERELAFLYCFACGENFPEERLLKKHVRESCKEGGIPKPSVKIPRYLLDNSKRKCIFGDCHQTFEDMPRLHNHLSKDHGMLINPNMNKAKRYIPKTPNIHNLGIKTEKLSNYVMSLAPPQTFAPLQLTTTPHPLQLLSHQLPLHAPLKTLDMGVTEGRSAENMCYNTQTKLETINDKHDNRIDGFSEKNNKKENILMNENMKLTCSECFATFNSPVLLDKHIQSNHN